MDFFDPKIILMAVSIFVSLLTVAYQYITHYSRLNRNRLIILTRAARDTELPEEWRSHFKDQKLDEVIFQAHKIRINNGRKRYILCLHNYLKERLSFRQLIKCIDYINFFDGNYRFKIGLSGFAWFIYSLVLFALNSFISSVLIFLIVKAFEGQPELTWQWNYLSLPLFFIFTLFFFWQSLKFIHACHISKTLKQLPAEARADLGV